MTGKLNTDKPDSNEPATLPGPATYEEELKDYSKTAAEDPLDNLPEKHPEPTPSQDALQKLRQSE